MRIYVYNWHIHCFCVISKFSLFYICFSFVVVYNQLTFLCFALRPPPPLFRVSESSELSDSFEELPRSKSPETALEAISGVQPELQNTPKDSEIYSKFYFFVLLFLFYNIFIYKFLQNFIVSPNRRYFFFFRYLISIEQNLIAEYLGNDTTRSFDDLLGPMPRNKNLFSGYHFILTCTIPIKKTRSVEV